MLPILICVLLLTAVILVGSPCLAAQDENRWTDNIDADWGGHFKIRGRVSRPAEDSPYRVVDDGTYLDGFIESRLKCELYFNEFAKFETHYETVLSGGDTLKNEKKLVSMVPGLSEEMFLRNRIPEDDRRLFDLTSVLSDKDDRILYHRIDRLVLTMKPDWGVLRIGRQAATWGNGMLFNPMDLFNPFSPTDIERDYKLGDDMVSVQTPLFDSGSVNVLYAPRRDPETSDASWEHSSLAAKVHVSHGTTEFDAMAARHYRDWVLGTGAVGYLGDAAWRMDLTWTILDSESLSNDYLSLVANIDYSWVWWEKNLYGFLEFYYSGIGEKDYQKALRNPDILERLDRGELFALGRTYIAANARLELHPLFNIHLTAINNLQDPSGVLQPRATYDVSDNMQILAGANAYWGEDGTEFGGVEIPWTEFTTRAADSIFAWLTYYY